MRVYSVPGERVIISLSAGNLATTQAVTELLAQAQGSSLAGQDINLCPSMFDAAQLIGDRLRVQLSRDADHVRPYADPNASFLIGGQIKGEAPRLFEIYSAGNFVETSNRRPFAQIGETKYGKPILDRIFRSSTPLEEATKLALLSFDATIRSNLSVDAPIDLIRYTKDSFVEPVCQVFSPDEGYWKDLADAYDHGLLELINQLPMPGPNAPQAHI